MNAISYTERCEIYKRALLLFGTDAQIKMFFEEAAELQNALCKLARGRDSADHVAEEIADLTIMLEQLRLIFSCNERVCEIMDEKCRRLAERIKKEEGSV